MRARDDHSQDGGFSSAPFQTTCDGWGGGGGYSAHEARAEDATTATRSAPSSPLRATAATTSAENLQPATDLLMVSTHRDAEGAWRATLHLRETPAGPEAPALTITVEPTGGGDEPDTLARFEVRAEGPARPVRPT